MTKKPGNPFEKDIIETVQSRKGDVADAIGMPDEQDYQTLARIIKRFERNNPGLIKFTLNEARKDFEMGAHGKNILWKGDAKVGDNLVYAFELPVDLYNAIEKVFPSMFRSKKHLQWFKRNFYKLTIADKQ